MFIDLDRFKLVNDRADHSAGDLVLKEMANRMTAMTRGVDMVARFGGDEFVAFAEVDHEEDALEMAERIRRGLSDPCRFGGGAAGRDREHRRRGHVGRLDTAPRRCCATPTTPCTTPSALGRDQVVLYRSNARDVANLKWGLRPTRASQLSAGVSGRG